MFFFDSAHGGFVLNIFLSPPTFREKTPEERNLKKPGAEEFKHGKSEA